jgi:phenylalanine-4-hydroxylase
MTYKLKSLDIGIHHQPQSLTMLRDIAKPKSTGQEKVDLRAEIASKDYFITLATRLDQVSQSLSAQQKSDYLLLEDCIHDLLYLHEYYRISKK